MSFSRLIVPAKVEDLNDPRGLPDWRDRSLYPKAGALTPAQWRWEFLRRDASYQAAWAKCTVDRCRKTIKYTCDQFYLGRLIEPRLSSHQVPVRDISFNGYLMQAGVAERYACGAAIQWLPAKFGRMPLDLYLREMEEFLTEANESEYLLAIIKPNDALQPQLEAIKKRVGTAASEKAKKMRNRERNYPVYLRLLDARRGRPRASLNEIAKLLGSEKRAGMTRQAARDLYKQAVARQVIMINSPQIA